MLLSSWNWVTLKEYFVSAGCCDLCVALLLAAALWVMGKINTSVLVGVASRCLPLPSFPGSFYAPHSSEASNKSPWGLLGRYIKDGDKINNGTQAESAEMGVCVQNAEISWTFMFPLRIISLLDWKWMTKKKQKTQNCQVLWV